MTIKIKQHLLSIGCNRKLAKVIGVFNLPAGKTCPGATPLCRKYCYCKKGPAMYPQAQAMRARNLIASRRDDFTDRMIEEIRSSGVSKVRIHESGDFYNQDYLNKWAYIIRANSDVTFLVYTKSFGLDFAGMCNVHNLHLYASMDPSTSAWEALRAPALRAYFMPKLTEEVRKDNRWKVCRPPEEGAHNYCGASCQWCWHGVGDVVFIKH